VFNRRMFYAGITSATILAGSLLGAGQALAATIGAQAQPKSHIAANHKPARTDHKKKPAASGKTNHARAGARRTGDRAKSAASGKKAPVTAAPVTAAPASAASATTDQGLLAATAAAIDAVTGDADNVLEGVAGDDTSGTALAPAGTGAAAQP
jgi:hypothetical protein